MDRRSRILLPVAYVLLVVLIIILTISSNLENTRYSFQGEACDRLAAKDAILIITIQGNYGSGRVVGLVVPPFPMKPGWTPLEDGLELANVDRTPLDGSWEMRARYEVSEVFYGWVTNCSIGGHGNLRSKKTDVATFVSQKMSKNNSNNDLKIINTSS